MFIKEEQRTFRRYPPLKHHRIKVSQSFWKLSWKRKFAEIPASKRFRNASQHNDQTMKTSESPDIILSDSPLEKKQKKSLTPFDHTSTSMSMQISPTKSHERPSFAKKIIE